MNKSRPIIYGVTHDGCHIHDFRRFFEWWYFDVDLKGGQHIYLEWHAPNFIARDESCLLVIRMHNNAKNKSMNSLTRSFRYHRCLIRQSETSCNIVFPSGHIVEKHNNYSISISEKELSINLTLTRLLPPVIAEDGVLYSTRDGEEFFAWNIAAPRAEVTGKIEVSGEETEVQGTAYHDHNWGNLNIGKHLRGWIWARFFFEGFAVVFGDITARGESGQKVQTLLVIDKDGRKLEISSLHVEYSGYRKHRNSFIPYDIFITCNNEKYKLYLQVENITTVQEFPLGSFKSHLWNSNLAKTYYLFRVSNAPNFIKKWFGGSLYFQFVAKGQLHVDGKLADVTNGNMEVFFFGN
jgi:hypothetical protein